MQLQLVVTAWEISARSAGWSNVPYHVIQLNNFQEYLLQYENEVMFSGNF